MSRSELFATAHRLQKRIADLKSENQHLWSLITEYHINRHPYRWTPPPPGYDLWRDTRFDNNIAIEQLSGHLDAINYQLSLLSRC